MLESLLVCLLNASSIGGGGVLRITLPASDAIVTAASVTIAGTSAAVSVEVRNGKRSTSVPVINNAWSVADVELDPGLNAVTVGEPGAAPVTLFITRGAGIAHRPQQKVRFDWTDGSDETIRDIAAGSLDPVPDAASQDRLVREAKALTREVFLRAFDGIADVHLVADDGDDVHTVRFLSFGDSDYGLTLSDCGNSELHGHSRVFLGAYRFQMVGHMERWLPMAAGDSLEIRIRDLAEMFGRTAAHELGHGVGLVFNADEDSPCSWMSGCKLSHSCAVFQSLHAGIHRFAAGQFIMDPGDDSTNNSRMAEPSPDNRARRRVPSVFCDFDRSYLGAIHPLPGGGTQ